MAIIGTMGLIGVAINDSIVVISALHDNHGVRPTSAEDFAATVSHCTRHVTATTLTTVAGFAPLILAGGEFWPPLAVAISGGVVGATLLALIFVPAAYRLVYCRSAEQVVVSFAADESKEAEPSGPFATGPRRLAEAY
jgi:multidrug efflux pump subunit AcrB